MEASNRLNSNYDVVIVGAGPVGLTTACTLKALNKNINICILEKHDKNSRSHGLHVQGDSVGKIRGILNEALKNQNGSANQDEIKKLEDIFAEWWKNSFPRTNEIQDRLIDVATKMGISILRGKEYEVNDKNYDLLFEPNKILKEIDFHEEETIDEKLSDTEKKLHAIFEKAQVIVGADGAHSYIRKRVMNNKLLGEKTLQYLIELKYETDGKTIPRNSFESSKEGSLCGQLDFETISKSSKQGKKPATLHIFTDKETYENLRQKVNGRLKGVFGNSWTLKEIKDKAKSNPKIKLIYQTFIKHLKSVKERGGSCEDEKISTLELRIFRSEDSLKKFGDKFVLLAGDANSGMVLERGFNKGLMEGALCAKAISEAFSTETIFENMPHQFLSYQEETRKIFENERWWSEFKMSWINAAQLTLRQVSRVFGLFNYLQRLRAFSSG